MLCVVCKKRPPSKYGRCEQCWCSTSRDNMRRLRIATDGPIPDVPIDLGQPSTDPVIERERRIRILQSQIAARGEINWRDPRLKPLPI